MAVGKDYDLLIYEMLFFPAKKLADRLGIPCVRQFSQPAWNQEAFQKLESSSKVFLFSSKLIGRQLMNASAAREMDLEGLKLVDSVLNDVPELNIVYLPDFFQPMRPTFDHRFIFVPPTIVQPQISSVEIPYEQMAGPIIYISLGTIISSKSFYRKCIEAFADQPINAAQVVELKIGKRLRFLGVSAKELAEEAFSILADREMKERCEEIKYKIAANLKISDAAEAIENYLANN